MLPLTAAVDAVSLPVVEEVLDNGLQVVVQPDASSSLVAVAVAYRVGSSSDPVGGGGLAHLVEHLMFEGSVHAPDYDGWLAQLGGASNAWTEPDATVYYAWGPPELLDLALHLEADRMVALALDERDLENQVWVVERERLGEGDWRAGFEALQRALWPPEHPYHRSMLGPPDELASLGLDEVQAHLDRFHGPAGAVLVIAGDVAPEVALASARRWFGDLDGGEPAAPTASVSPRAGRFHAALGRADASVWVGWALEREQAAQADLLAEVLDLRLRRRIRGPVLDAGALAWHGALAGELVLHLQVDERGTARRARVLRRELRRVARRGPRPEELQQAAVRLWSHELEATERLEQRASTLAWCAALHGASSCVEDRVAAWWSAEREQVRDLARELRDREPAIVHVDEPLGLPLEPR